MRARVLLATIIATSLLAGCGVRGELERPAPMFGKARADFLAQQEREKSEKAAREARGEVATPPPPEQPIQTSPIQAGIAPPIPTTPAR